MISRLSFGRFSRISFIKSRNLVTVRAVVAICSRNVVMLDLPAKIQVGTGCGRPFINYNVRRRARASLADLRFEFSGLFKISVFTEVIDILLNLGRSET